MKPSTSFIVGLILTIYHHLYGVAADYELILRQKDARTALFSSNVRNTYLENEDNPDANTFTNIGDLTSSDFADENGYYQFKLIYTNLHHYSVTNKVDNQLSVTLEWKQTSWLTETSIAGYTPINVPTETRADSSEDFNGLGRSSRDETLLDGDAYGHSNWWNSVGTISSSFQGRIPAFDEQTATAAALYVYREDTTTTTTTTTETPRDCAILDIDGFLMECSTEFPSQISTIHDTMDDFETEVSTNFTALKGRVKTLEDEAGSVFSEIEALADELTAVNTRIDEFGISAAVPPSMGFIKNEPNGVESVGLNGKDIFIIFLLLINLIGMIYNHYRIQSKGRRSLNGKKYAVQFDEETDMEPINK